MDLLVDCVSVIETQHHHLFRQHMIDLRHVKIVVVQSNAVDVAVAVVVIILAAGVFVARALLATAVPDMIHGADRWTSAKAR